MYSVILSLHLIAVISWMAALLYLPRLYVYHADAALGGEADMMLRTMERRLLRYIASPAMIAAFVAGLFLLHLNPALLSAPWVHMKITLVLGLAAFHGVCAAHRKKLETGRGAGARFYRIFNEIPTLLMVIIVFLAVCKPGFGR